MKIKIEKTIKSKIRRKNTTAWFGPTPHLSLALNPLPNLNPPHDLSPLRRCQTHRGKIGKLRHRLNLAPSRGVTECRQDSFHSYHPTHGLCKATTLKPLVLLQPRRFPCKPISR